jgi:hypothetical protein
VRCLAAAAAVVVGLLVSGCNDKNDQIDKLVWYTDSYCHMLRYDLEQEVQCYHERDRSALSFGFDLATRGPVSLELMRGLTYCVNVRRVDPAVRDGLSLRFGAALARFGRTDVFVEALAALDELAVVAAEIDALPLID